jgi:ATP-dependent HslUV protease, peptidase subunit HslV
MDENRIRSTTVLAVRYKGKVAMAGDGQVTMGNTVMKNSARKIRKIYDGKILTGFAGATADALTLFEKFEGKVEEYKGNLTRASVELAKEWRTNKMLRQLEALLLVANTEQILLIGGTGDVIEPDDSILAIGSGGPYAIAAARAIMKFAPKLTATEIAKEAMMIAASICIYTNENIMIEEVEA